MFLALSLSIILASCRKEDKIKVKVEKTEFVNYSADYSMPKKYLNTYFVDDSDTRYVDAVGFMKTLKGLYMTEYMRVSSSFSSDSLSIFMYVLTEENGQPKKVSATFNWIDDTITISDSIFFNVINMSSETDYARYISEKKGEQTETNPATFKLADFGFNIYYKNAKALIPFSIMNTIFCSSDYYNIYYDGTKYFGVTYDISAYKDQETLKTCDLNNQEQTPELRQQTYDHLRFVLYYYYGLKEYKGITDIDEELKDYKEGILSLDPEVNKNTYYSYFINHLDELHTRIGAYSFYYDPKAKATADNWDLSKTSEFRKQYKQVEEELKTLSEGFYDTENYVVSGNTAMISMTTFTTGTNDQVSGADAYNYDTFEFMKYTLDKLENRNVTNVVVDVSQNGGGNMGALLRVLGLLSDDSIEYISYDYLFNSRTNGLIDIDVDGDGNYEDNDAYSEFNWYILSSLDTFSAANSFVAMSKSLGATIIGQKSGGGMCSVLPIILPDQTSIEISSPDAQMAKLNDEYQFIEGGIEPDIYIDYNNFYNIEYIKSVLA